MKLPAAEHEGYTFKCWYTGRYLSEQRERTISPAGASASMQDGKKKRKTIPTEKMTKTLRTKIRIQAALSPVLEEGREQSQKEAAAELEELFYEMEADAERYRQEYEAEMREKGLEAYDWDALCSENEDIKGWLCIPDTLINFPVVGTDDNAFYLSHDFSGEKSSAGCPFMDKDMQVWDFNRIIYGHNMGTGSDAMFSTLLDYEKEDYLKEHRIIYFTDAYGSAAAYQVMAVVKYSIDNLEEWDFRTRNHGDMESYNAWMEELQGRALYYTEPDHAPTSIITLATCDRRVHGLSKDFRYVKK